VNLKFFNNGLVIFKEFPITWNFALYNFEFRFLLDPSQLLIMHIDEAAFAEICRMHMYLGYLCLLAISTSPLSPYRSLRWTNTSLSGAPLLSHGGRIVIVNVVLGISPTLKFVGYSRSAPSSFPLGCLWQGHRSSMIGCLDLGLQVKRKKAASASMPSLVKMIDCSLSFFICCKPSRSRCGLGGFVVLWTTL
jgi:hypothetical protein